jgi:aspartyl protease/tetratricopeptide repeat protein
MRSVMRSAIVRGCRTAALAAAAILGAALATAEWLQPDASYRDAQFELRAALRDTVGRAEDPARLDTLGVALLRLGRFAEAERVFRRVLAQRPADVAALAGLGKMALFADRLEAADSLLVAAAGAGTMDAELAADLYALHLRRGRWTAAAGLAAEVNQVGRVPLLRQLAEREPYRIAAGPEQARVPWARAYPVPLVRVKLNGQSVLMALDTGAPDLLLDRRAARQAKVRLWPAQSVVFWCGTRIAAEQALVARLEIGGMVVEDLPAGVGSLRKWSLHVNPHSEAVAGVIGLQFLRRFTPTLDYAGHALLLRRPRAGWSPPADARRVPFEIWGESELTVYGSLAGGRRMAMVVQSGVPGCGVGAPVEVFEEVGVKPGVLARAVKGAGNWLQGRPWTSVQVPTVSIGPLVRERVAGWAGALDSAELWRHGVRRDALLSHDFFRDQRVTFDWSARELVIEPRP